MHNRKKPSQHRLIKIFAGMMTMFLLTGTSASGTMIRAIASESLDQREYESTEQTGEEEITETISPDENTKTSKKASKDKSAIVSGNTGKNSENSHNNSYDQSENSSENDSNHSDSQKESSSDTEDSDSKGKNKTDSSTGKVGNNKKKTSTTKDKNNIAETGEEIKDPKDDPNFGKISGIHLTAQSAGLQEDLDDAAAKIRSQEKKIKKLEKELKNCKLNTTLLEKASAILEHAKILRQAEQNRTNEETIHGHLASVSAGIGDFSASRIPTGNDSLLAGSIGPNVLMAEHAFVKEAYQEQEEAGDQNSMTTEVSVSEEPRPANREEFPTETSSKNKDTKEQGDSSSPENKDSEEQANSSSDKDKDKDTKNPASSSSDKDKDRDTKDPASSSSDKDKGAKKQADKSSSKNKNAGNQTSNATSKSKDKSSEAPITSSSDKDKDATEQLNGSSSRNKNDGGKAKTSSSMDNDKGADLVTLGKSCVKQQRKELRKKIQAGKKTKKKLNKYKDGLNHMIIVFDSTDVTKVSNITAGLMKEVLEGTLLQPLAKAYVDMEKKYGINAIALCALSALESGWGTSERAIKDHNYTGLGVYSDTAVGINADSGEENLDMTAHRLATKYLKKDGEFYHGEGLDDLNQCYCTTGTWAGSIEDIGRRIMNRLRAVSGTAGYEIYDKPLNET